jgi:hypothetical protein
METHFNSVGLKVMSFSEQTVDEQAKTIKLANHYFERIKEVLIFLQDVREVGHIRSKLPTPFFMPNIFDRPHLAIQRQGSNYDGKYYVLDVFANGEEPATETRIAEFADIWLAFSELEKLYGFIAAQDKATATP